MELIFTKDEKEKMQQTLTNIVSDLRSIYELAEVDTIRHEFKITEKEREETYYLVINAKEMYLKLAYSDWYMNLEKVRVNKENKVCPIKDFNLIFQFFNKYEEIREIVKRKASRAAAIKGKGMSKINELMDRYSKEATIEVDMPETVNQTNIEVTQENGKNVSRIKVGPISLKILASSNVKIVGKKEEQPKIKRK